MELSEDAVVEIPQARLGFFGGPGNMLLPSPATVAALIAKVPARKLITTDLLCQCLPGIQCPGNMPRHRAAGPSGRCADPSGKLPIGGCSRRTENSSTDSLAGLTVRPNA